MKFILLVLLFIASCSKSGYNPVGIASIDSTSVDSTIVDSTIIDSAIYSDDYLLRFVYYYSGSDTILSDYTVYEYDSCNRKSKEATTYASTTEFLNYCSYEYTYTAIDSIKTKTECKNFMGVISCITSYYKYDISKRLVEMEVEDPGANDIYRYYYDTLDNLIEVRRYYYSGAYSSDKYYYNSYNDLIKHESYSSKDSLTRCYIYDLTYDINNNIIKKKEISGYGVNEILYEYDVNNNLIKESYHGSRYFYIYKYDSLNNLILKEVFLDNELTGRWVYKYAIA